ncbi:BcNRPS1, nonribosomal peptide synthetase [Xylariaceae sp. FL0594]|nr:BcNRPS1, nonribosomal peptide synthetase [Xylariaceae sp. FL0594]
MESLGQEKDAILLEICLELETPAHKLDLHSSFVRNGGNSLSALKICSSYRAKGIAATVAQLLGCDTLIDFLSNVMQHQSNGNSPNKTRLCSDSIKNSLRDLQCQPTPMQQSMIHGSHAGPGVNIIQYCEIYATAHILHVKRAWEILVSTEPIFRTQFRVVNDLHCLFESPDPHVNWREIEVDNREAFQVAQKVSGHPHGFTGIAFKIVHLVHDTEPRQSAVIWIVHHALLDGYSRSLLLNKHRRILAGDSVEPAPSYVQFIQRTSTPGTFDAGASEEFWSVQRSKIEMASGEFHLDRPNIPYDPTYAYHDVALAISDDALKKRANASGVTVASVFHAAWALTLSRFVGSSHVCFGTVISGRSLPLDGVEAVVGLLIHTVPFQITVDSNSKASDFLMSVFRHAVALDDNLWSTPPYQAYGDRLASVVNIHTVEPLLVSNTFGFQEEPQTTLSSNVPLCFEVYSQRDIKLLYHRHSFHDYDIQRLAQVFSRADCDDVLLDAPTRSQLERNSNILSQMTNTQASYETLVDLFHQTAISFPRNIAIEKDQETMTYSQLYLQADKLSQILARYVQPGDIICVYTDRSIDWIIAIYGVLSAGCVYCPLDATLPTSIQQEILTQSGSKLILACSQVVKELLQHETDLLQSQHPVDERNRYQEAKYACPNAYLCFTSGSTGKPKGVLCTHQSLVALHREFDVRMNIFEIFSALSYGSTLVLPSSADPFEHLTRVNCAIMTPSIAGVVVSDKWTAKVEAFNMYGPTETTCGITIKKLEFQQPVTLGKPTASGRVYVLDHRLRLTLPGVIGEIYLAGVQVSQGYINKLEETKRKFIPDCVSGRPGERMYKTGDRGYWDQDGELHFCGRQDRQIKLRGFRIDLDDVEYRICNALAECTGAAVTRLDDALVAQLKPLYMNMSQIRSRLLEALPAYAIPKRISTVSQFPQTNAGKVDYKSIASSFTVAPQTVSVTPKSELHDSVVVAWKEALGFQDINFSSESNFVELGGHSLLQLRLVNKLSSLLGYAVPLALIVQSPTLGTLVERLTATRAIRHNIVSDDKAEDESHRPSSIQESWWRRYQLGPGTSSFNVSLCFETGPGVDPQRLATAWNDVLSHHPGLRCQFTASAEGPIEKKFRKEAPTAVILEPANISQLLNQTFNLEHDALIRVHILPKNLVIVASHIICDYTSLETMLREVGDRYTGVRHPEHGQIRRQTRERPPTADDKAFWSTHLRGCPPSRYNVSKLSMDRKSYSGSSHSIRICSRRLVELNDFLSSRTMTAHQLALAAVAVALQHDTESIDLILGAPHLGRGDLDANTVDLFVEPLPIRITYPLVSESRLYDERTSTFFDAVKRCSQEALCHAIPFDEILKVNGLVDRGPDNPLFDVMVSYHENFNQLSIPGVDADLMYTWTDGAKFKLMVEFIVVSQESLMLRLEYSDEIFSTSEVGLLGRRIAQALEMLIGNVPLGEVKKVVASLSDAVLDPFFGSRLKDI